MTILSRLFVSPYKCRRDLETALQNSSPDFIARQLGYASLPDLQAKAAAEGLTHKLGTLTAAERQKLEAQLALAKAEEGERKARELESQRRDHVIVSERIEARLTTLRAQNYESVETDILREAIKLEAVHSEIVVNDPHRYHQLSQLALELARIRLLKQVQGAAITVLETELEEHQASLAVIEKSR